MILVGGFNPSEKYEFVSWDDDIPKYLEKNMFQTTSRDISTINPSEIGVT